ncbi:hypothetical protein K3G63_22000 [Hymenobacter sp. HSC-4F20]|uniref:hypothetical protein n=1 Tax=Hymenobacter sp. HSC-4F20 TaxID=2864135 RepID=UPI001C72E678|nr:hypothetical protein [Hymenobacter sp. HSC-4F20]MBX0293134.1 hypothetical protein [Hymenobacter sp. HSC-4F20]
MSHSQTNALNPAVHKADFSHPGYQAMHRWFGQSYANYLILPRVQLQSMPEEWQQRFASCLREFTAAFAGSEQARSYQVRAIDAEGHYVKDPVPHYDGGRARLPINTTGHE